MLAGAGRPRKACFRCNGHKVRCTGERPACKRCTRLKHNCEYRTGTPPASAVASKLPRVGKPSISRSQTLPLYGTTVSPIGSRYNHGTGTPRHIWPAPTVQPDLPVANRYLGIPDSLVLVLVDIYFEHVYNASLLLHKRTFLSTLAASTACQHVVLSVCAFAMNFYPTTCDNSLLHNHDFSTEWADQAGKLAFQDMENPTENHVVTFANLGLFWYSQGQWRRSAIHKGNAAQISHLLGLGTEKSSAEDSFQSEVRRRRFWACYFSYCHAYEMGPVAISGDTTRNLTLPWRDEDFESMTPTLPRVSLRLEHSNGGVFCELAKALTLWSEVNILVKTPEGSMSERLNTIYVLDERISRSWATLPESLWLRAADIPGIAPQRLPNLMLLHVVHYQTLCALHASIVPLFSWSAAESSWLMARQTSAQVAYESACTVSSLIYAAVSSNRNLSTLPSFVAYAAYSGCAIQIPFLWCSNTAIQAKAQHNVKANVKLMHIMAKHWKFTALLENHVRVIYKIHAHLPIVLTDEPRFLEPLKLMSARVNASGTRDSILGHNSILWGAESVFRTSKDTDKLTVEDEDNRSSETCNADSSNPEHRFYSEVIGRNQLTSSSSSRTAQTTTQDDLFPPPVSSDPYPRYPTEHDFGGIETLDFFHPFHDPEMLDLFSEGQPLQFPTFDTSPAGLDLLGLWPTSAENTTVP